MHELAISGLLSIGPGRLLPSRLVCPDDWQICIGTRAQLNREAKKFVNLSLLR